MSSFSLLCWSTSPNGKRKAEHIVKKDQGEAPYCQLILMLQDQQLATLSSKPWTSGSQKRSTSSNENQSSSGEEDIGRRKQNSNQSWHEYDSSDMVSTKGNEEVDVVPDRQCWGHGHGGCECWGKWWCKPISHNKAMKLTIMKGTGQTAPCSKSSWWGGQRHNVRHC